MKSKQKFQTKEQLLYRLQEGVAFGDGEEYNPMEYQKMACELAQQFQENYYGSSDNQAQGETYPTGTNYEGGSNNNSNNKRMTPQSLERDYWKLVESESEEFITEYGNDIDTQKYWSGFPLSERGRCLGGKVNEEKINLPEPKFGTEDFYKETYWNLNNIAFAPEGMLQHVKVGINGINVPWLYFGSLFSTFCWHNEDNYLYSINYHHKGCPKQWYGVPGTRKDAEGLERVFKNSLSMKMRDVPDLLHHITTMFSPRLLQQGGVPAYKILQFPGEFVVTFPRAFHGGFSLGPNVGEAVNFASHDWIAHGADASERYRSFSRSAVFSHDRLVFTMANHYKEMTSYHNCKALAKEMQRIIDEEMELRSKLLTSGVRDVSKLIILPKNRVDQLDEESADYDDKRLCHSCKHVCFFSAIGCQCSQSKVSCLRHSQSMCRCPPEVKYLMEWNNEKDMKDVLENVKKHCEFLKEKYMSSGKKVSDLEESKSESEKAPLPPVAPGVEKDMARHMDYEIDFSLTDYSDGDDSSRSQQDVFNPSSSMNNNNMANNILGGVGGQNLNYVQTAHTKNNFGPNEYNRLRVGDQVS